jgi:hypothetical protein
MQIHKYMQIHAGTTLKSNKSTLLSEENKENWQSAAKSDLKTRNYFGLRTQPLIIGLINTEHVTDVFHPFPIPVSSEVPFY